MDSRPLEVDQPKDSNSKSHKDYRDHEAAMPALESRISVRDSGFSHSVSVGFFFFSSEYAGQLRVTGPWDGALKKKRGVEGKRNAPWLHL